MKRIIRDLQILAKTLFLLGIFFLVTSALAIITHHSGLGSKLINYGYLLLCLAIVFYIFESLKSAKD